MVSAEQHTSSNESEISRFMPADSLWMFCMAVNVFLTFQTSKIHVNLRSMEKWYFLLCFGLPGIPALTYLILDTTRGTYFYGDAIVSTPRPFPPRVELTPEALVLDRNKP
jgi:hypothetical protein